MEVNNSNSLTIQARYLKISPSKIQPIATLVRRDRIKGIDHSLNTLRFLPNKGARIIYKILQGAKKQILNNKKAGEKPSDIMVSKIEIGRGTIMKRQSIRARGRTDIIKKTNCHLFLNLISK
jgi:large subunit ribosomal protein L22